MRSAEQRELLVMAPNDPKPQTSDRLVQIRLALIEAGHTYHGLYVAVHRAHKEAPGIWKIQDCTRILTAILAARSFSWHVVGITDAALKIFAEQQFRNKSRSGITRAHLKPRNETVRALFAKDEPLNESDFWRTWLEADKTVLCARGENKTPVPPYRDIENANCELFTSTPMGWRHGRREQEYLQTLFERGLRG